LRLINTLRQRSSSFWNFKTIAVIACCYLGICIGGVYCVYKIFDALEPFDKSEDIKDISPLSKDNPIVQDRENSVLQQNSPPLPDDNPIAPEPFMQQNSAPVEFILTDINPELVKALTQQKINIQNMIQEKALTIKNEDIQKLDIKDANTRNYLLLTKVLQ